MSELDLDIEAVVAGELDAAARAELERRLAEDPELLRAALQAYRVRQLLPLAVRGRGGDRFAEAVCKRIKPPSGRFVRRIEESVQRHIAARHAGRWRWALPLAAAALIAIGSAFWQRSPQVDERPIAAPMPRVAHVAASADDRPTVSVAGGALAQGEVLTMGRELDLPADAAATLRWDDGTTVALSGGAHARVAPAVGKRLELDRGRIDCAAAHQPPGRPLVIATPHGEATVVGTRFTLEVGDETLLRVSEGAVSLRGRDGAEVIVHAGEEGRARTAPVYERDFLAGLPPGWQHGTLVEDPTGLWSRYAALERQQENGQKPTWLVVSEDLPHTKPHFRFDSTQTVELTLAQDMPAEALLLFVLCRADTGDYVTNVMVHVNAPEQAGWQTLRLPLSTAFSGLDQVGDAPAVCTAWLLQSFHRRQNLRLARLALVPR